jgi:vancomycin permeability regulator SanA
MNKQLSTMKALVQTHKTLCTFVALLPLVFILSIFVLTQKLITSNQKYVVTNQSAPRTKVGLVLGAGISSENRPYKELQARLDVAADALEQGVVEKLLLSGDNRFENYDEPTAMYTYLLEERKIPAEKLERDFAGRSTYESCERAAKIFQLKETIIFSAESHLARAIYLCRHFGVEAYGISSEVEANNSGRREPLARIKALYNVYLFGEKTVLGEPIPLE